MKIHNVPQNSPEWLQLRLGIPTASEFSRIVTPKTGQPSKSADGYLHKLIAEWILGTPLEQEETQWMIRGHELETQAVQAYEFETDRETELVGFVTNDYGLYGCSPDRLVGSDGILEIKCPAPWTHVGYLLAKTVEQDYWPQVQGQMYVCEREWVDIVSYCPGFPSSISRVNRDEKWITILVSCLNAFIDRLQEAKVLLGQRYGITGKILTSNPADDDISAFGISQQDIEDLIALKFPPSRA